MKGRCHQLIPVKSTVSIFFLLKCIQNIFFVFNVIYTELHINLPHFKYATYKNMNCNYGNTLQFG